MLGYKLWGDERPAPKWEDREEWEECNRLGEALKTHNM